MKETEVKILNVDKNKIINSLLNLKAKKIFDDEISTIFFDFTDGRIFNTKNLLRLRQAGPKSTLTYKKILTTESVKEAQEYEVEISNLQTMKNNTRIIGLEGDQKSTETSNKLQTRKHPIRHRYLRGRTRIIFPHFLKSNQKTLILYTNMLKS